MTEFKELFKDFEVSDKVVDPYTFKTRFLLSLKGTRIARINVENLQDLFFIEGERKILNILNKIFE